MEEERWWLDHGRGGREELLCGSTRATPKVGTQRRRKGEKSWRTFLESALDDVAGGVQNGTLRGAP